MALRIELAKDILVAAFAQAISSKQRAIKQTTNAIIKQALEQELSAIQTAVNTIQEVK